MSSFEKLEKNRSKLEEYLVIMENNDLDSEEYNIAEESFTAALGYIPKAERPSYEKRYEEIGYSKIERKND